MGLHRAGFDVVGIDIKPQPRYPFPFIRGDALNPPVRLEDFDLVWASPPCQAYSSLKTMRGAGGYPRLVEQTRGLVSRCRSWVIENVAGAPLLSPTMLCGSFFGLEHGGYQLRRHRFFECSFFVMDTPCTHGLHTVGVYGEKARDIAREKRHYSRPKATRGRPIDVVLPWDVAVKTMGIDWMNRAETSEAIPPAYSAWIGRYALMALGRAVE